MVGHLRTFWRDWDLHSLRAVGLSFAYQIATLAFMLYSFWSISGLLDRPFADMIFIPWDILALSLLFLLPGGYFASVIATWLARDVRDVFPITAAIFALLTIGDNVVMMIVKATDGVSIQPSIFAASSVTAIFGLIVAAIHIARKSYLRMIYW